MEEIFVMAKKNSTCIAISYMTLVVTVIGIIFSIIPAMDTLSENIWYELELIGGSVFFVWIAYYLWGNYEKRSKKNG